MGKFGSDPKLMESSIYQGSVSNLLSHKNMVMCISEPFSMLSVKAL